MAPQPLLIESAMQKEVSGDEDISSSSKECEGKKRNKRWSGKRTWRMKLLLVLVGILLVMLASSLRKAPVGQH